MNQNLKSNQRISELKQMQTIMMGGLEKKQPTLSFEEIKKMEKDYVGMYYGFVSINWGQGMTLGMAWQKGLEQMEAFVASKMKIANHPANKEFLKIHKDWRQYLAKRIMTSEYSEYKLKPEYGQDFVNYGTKRIKEKKQALNDLYQKHMPKEPVQQTQPLKRFDLAKQKTQQLMQQAMLQQMMYQRAA